MLANMYQKPYTSRNSKPEAHPVVQPYEGIDLPLSDDEEDSIYEEEDSLKKSRRKERASDKSLEALNLNLIRTSESEYSVEKSEFDFHLNLNKWLKNLNLNEIKLFVLVKMSGCVKL
ncbi:hypothetical protein Tco_0586057 [Tanacetum coccineum]